MKTKVTGSDFLAGLRARVVDGRAVLELAGEPIGAEVPITLHAGELAALILGAAARAVAEARATASAAGSRRGVVKYVLRDGSGRISGMVEEPATLVGAT